jgi:hypothetical protein
MFAAALASTLRNLRARQFSLLVQALYESARRANRLVDSSLHRSAEGLAYGAQVRKGELGHASISDHTKSRRIQFGGRGSGSPTGLRFLCNNSIPSLPSLPMEDTSWHVMQDICEGRPAFSPSITELPKKVGFPLSSVKSV